MVEGCIKKLIHSQGRCTPSITITASNMKLSVLAVTYLTTLANVEAFGVLPSSSVMSLRSPLTSSTLGMGMHFADEVEGDAKSEDAKSGGAKTIYDRIGFEEDKVAMGVNVNEVLQWLGTREDIISRFQRDNKGMELERAQTEVDKFILDAEMVNSFIAYEKKKSEPGYLKSEAEAALSDPQTWGTYAAWIIGGAGFAYVKNVIIEPKYASGEWEEIRITLPGAEKFAAASAEAAAQGADAAVGAAADVSAVVDAASNAL